MCYCPTLAALLSHFKYFFLFQRCCTICLCSRADEKGVMQAPKFEIFPGLILFQDRRDPFFAACLFVLLSHLCQLQSWKKSTSITAPPCTPPSLLHLKHAPYLLAATADGHGQHRSIVPPGGKAGPVCEFYNAAKWISAEKHQGTGQSTLGVCGACPGRLNW